MKTQPRPQLVDEDYGPPALGAAVPLASVTLFSGTVDPDAGVIEFGGG
jgi:hypothetical protein